MLIISTVSEELDEICARLEMAESDEERNLIKKRIKYLQEQEKKQAVEKYQAVYGY